MKKNKKILVSLLSAVLCLVFVFIFVLDQKEEKATIVVTLAHDKGNLPIFQENFLKQGEAAKKAIGIGINPIPSQTTDLYMHQMKASLPTEQAPDLFTWWSGLRVKELVDKNLVSDLKDLWDKYHDEYPKGIKDAFTIKGKMYGFPHSVNYWPVWYNKTIFKRFGLEEPKTWAEFIKTCETLKSSGITPILSSLQDRWPAFIWFEEMIIGEDPNLYNDLCIGKAKYTDPRVKKAFGVWGEMIKKGYFTDPSANMLTNAGYLWNKENYGMVLAGTWYHTAILIAQGVDENSIGSFILPSHNPDAGNNIIFEVGPILTAKNSRQTQIAQKVADWWMGSEGNGHFARLHKAYPGNLKTDTSYLPPVKKKLLSTIKSGKYRVLNRYWEATPAAIGGAAVDKFAEFILNPNNLDNILKDIDTICDQYWSENNRE